MNPFEDEGLVGSLLLSQFLTLQSSVGVEPCQRIGIKIYKGGFKQVGSIEVVEK